MRFAIRILAACLAVGATADIARGGLAEGTPKVIVLALAGVGLLFLPSPVIVTVVLGIILWKSATRSHPVPKKPHDDT